MNIISSLLYFIGGRMIAEEGTSDGWKYRKWENGKIEAWNTVVKNSDDVTTPIEWGNIYYYDLGVSLPEGLFDYAPTQILATSKNAQFIVMGAWSVTSSGFTLRLMRPSQTKQRVDVSLYVVYQ